MYIYVKLFIANSYHETAQLNKKIQPLQIMF